MLRNSSNTQKADLTKPEALRLLKSTARSEASLPWMETKAEVTGCRYRFAGMSIMLFGVDTDHDHFMVSFSYYAHAQIFHDECASPVAMAKGESFPIFYNPLNPRENNRFNPFPGGRSPLIALGVAGSILLSLLYLVLWAVFRSC